MILAVLSLGGIAYALLQSLVVPALPQIQESLNTSQSAVGWVLTAFLLSASVTTPIVGRLGDMYGKERLLLIVLVVLAVGTLISAVASSLPLMLVGRVIQGVGGGIFPLAFSIIRDELPRERVAGGIGLVSSLLGHRWRRRRRLRRRRDREPLLSLALLVPARDDLVHRAAHLALHPRIAGQDAGARQLPRGGPDDGRDLGDPSGDHRDQHLGLGLTEDARPARARRCW